MQLICWELGFFNTFLFFPTKAQNEVLGGSFNGRKNMKKITIRAASLHVICYRLYI